MKAQVVWVTLLAIALSAGASAADLTVASRPEAVRAIAKPATQGIGYSVLYDAGTRTRSYRVHVICMEDETFAVAHCPSVTYQASCPRAGVLCR